MYIGESFKIKQSKGWNANPDIDDVSPESMIDCENINIHHGGRQPRGGCELVTDMGTEEIRGVFQFIRENGDVAESYVIDEGSDNIGDEDGNYLVSEGSYIMCCENDGTISVNYDTDLKTGLTADTYYNFEVFYDELYISNGVDKPQVYGANLDYTWDIGSPIACTGALAGAAGNVDNGTHSYKVTFVTADGESSAGVKSNVVTVANKAVDGQVSLTSIPVGPSGTTSRKVYRTVAGDTGDYLLLTTIANNTTTTYTDNTADSGLGAASPSTSLAFLPTDWQSSWPKYFLKHGRGLHKRLWAYGVVSYPNVLYASLNGLADFSDSNVTTVKILSDEITGAVDFGGNLIVFSRDKTYILDDAAISVSNWGYGGGAAHQKLIVKTPNDVAVMDESGNIFSIRASQQYGDYEIASLTKPHYIDKWIDENVDLERIEKFHGIYDPFLRAIKWFMVSYGHSSPDICLVYFIDYAMWTRHNFLNIFETNIYHLCSGLIKINDAVWKIYTGNSNGEIYSLESETLTDNDVYYRKYFKTPLISMNNSRMSKMFDRIILVIKPQGQEKLVVKVIVDDSDINDYQIVMSGRSDFMQNVVMYSGVTGLRLQLEISSYDDNDFFISDIMIDYKQLGYIDNYIYVQTIAGLNKGYIFSGYAAIAYLQDCDEYDSVANSWISMTDMDTTGRIYLAASTILNKGYVYGGWDPTLFLRNNCDEFDPSLNSWLAKTNMISGRAYHSASTILNKGYVYGGNDGSYTRACDEYNSIDDEWTNKADMPVSARGLLAASTILNKGYVYGGTTGSATQDCDEYDSVANSWASMTNLPSPARSYPGGATILEKGYIFGGLYGTTYLQDCDEFDSIGDSWASKTDMILPGRRIYAASTILNKGYAYNGESLVITLLRDCDEYDSVNDSWVSKADIPLPARKSSAGTTI